jgi:hypothetical protein
MTGGAIHLGKAGEQTMNSVIRSLALVILAVAALAGCGKSATGLLVAPKRPQVELTFAPIEGDSVSYSVRINWSGSDSDGQVVGFQYAVDPPASPSPGNDTVWVDTRTSEVSLLFQSRTPRRPLAPPGFLVPSSDYHTFVIRAIDNEGLRSEPKYQSFTSFTIAPSTRITVPNGTALLSIRTTPSVTMEWVGEDPDGTQRPVKYKFKLASAADLNPSDPGSITAGLVQQYFEADAVNYFATWDSVSGDTTSRFFEGLTPGTRYFFAIVAFDEAGAYEPRFNRDSNVLDFTPTLDKLGPKIRVFNEFFSREQVVGGVSLAESRIVKLQFPANASLVFNWSADPPQQGALITGYRWAVDIAGQDITNETPREDDNDFSHWSVWSLNETSARVGPFFATPESSSTHYFYLEARDNLGFVSLFTIRLTIVKPSFANPLLVIDDLYGPPTNGIAGNPPPYNIRLAGAYPLEAEADTFYYARGGFPDSLYIRSSTNLNAVSLPGVFADYGPDTLDYRFYPIDGIDLQKLSEYRVVCWYTDGQSAARNGSKFGSVSPQTAIRAINSTSRLNTLAVYLRQGGSAWLFGEGTTTSIANGYWSRFGTVPRLPYTSGEDPRQNVLFPGNFLWDFVHMRSELNTAGASTFIATQLVSCIPYLPQYAGPASTTDRTHDPRIDPRPGAGAERTGRNDGPLHPGWANLPQLTIFPYRGAIAAPGINGTYVIKQPLQITGPGPAFIPTMDTLYLFQAREYDPNHIYEPNAGDGYPNAVHYYGTDNGPRSQLVWFGFPLHYFDRDQVKVVVAEVMKNLGVAPAAPSLRGAHPAVRGDFRIVDDGETVDDRTAATGRTRR